MPFTPFHFGPGLLLKSVAPRRVSFIAFAATQVVIDVESLVHLARNDWPVHRQMHSLIGASIVGLIIGALVVIGRQALERVGASTAWSGLKSGWTVQAALVGGLLGGATHSLLDAVMHTDVTPLWPFVAGNRLAGLVSPDILQVGCLLAGVIGVGVLWRRRGGQA